jgi:hypothetical protein
MWDRWRLREVRCAASLRSIDDADELLLLEQTVDAAGETVVDATFENPAKAACFAGLWT